MALLYTISISNKSGAKQSYAIFAEKPYIKCSGGSAVPIITGIISSVRGVAFGNGEASFLLSKNLYATCGTYDVEFSSEADGNKTPIGTGTEVIDQRPVTLGRKDAEGHLIGGSLLEIDADDGAPTFAEKEAEMKADLDCFAIKTMGDFTASEARMNKFVLGFSSSLKHSTGPYATFIPSPGQIYQIQPTKIFYVVIGSFNSRDLIKKENFVGQTSTCMVDFGALGTDSVQLLHDEHNSLHIVTALVDNH